MILSREDAILRWRRLVGPTDVRLARDTAPYTLRARFGVDHQRNACHGSDSTESAEREIRYFFPHGVFNTLSSHVFIEDMPLIFLPTAHAP